MKSNEDALINKETLPCKHCGYRLQRVSQGIAFICHPTKLNPAWGVLIIWSLKQKKLFNWDVPLLTHIFTGHQDTGHFTPNQHQVQVRLECNASLLTFVAKGKMCNVYNMLGLY